MPQWLRHWRDWAIPGLFGNNLRSASPMAHGLLFSYEKAGLCVRNEPIPWNADRLRVEALLRVPSGVVRRKADFCLLCNNLPLGPPETLRIEDGSLLRLGFNLPPPASASLLTLAWRDQELGQSAMPLLRESDFFDHLELRHATVAVKLGEQFVPCTAFLPAQSRHLLLSGVLASPTSLAPLAGQELVLEVFDGESKPTSTLVTRLAACQLQQRETLWQVPLHLKNREAGPWTFRWRASDRVLARSELRSVPRRRASQMLACPACYFVRQAKGHGQVEFLSHLAAADANDWLGMVFLLKTTEPGLATRAELRVFLEDVDGRRGELPLHEEIANVTDGPTPIVTPLLPMAELASVRRVLLLCGSRLVTTLGTQAVPQCSFTGEGGIRAVLEDFPWSPNAEAELADRLKKLSAF